MSLEESYFLDDESDNDGSDSGSSGTFNFPFCFYDSVGHVSGLGYGGFVPIGVKSKCDVVRFFVFVPIGVESKCGKLIGMF